jgi:hypothetical protein
MKLRFPKTTIKELNWYPIEDDKWGKAVLLLICPLTIQLSEKLKCRGLCFDENRMPRQFEGKIGLPVKISGEGTDIEFGDRMFNSGLVHKFKVGRKDGAEDSDVTLHVTLRAHFDGKQVHHLLSFCQEKSKDEFSFSIEPAQGALSFMDEEGEPESEADEVVAAVAENGAGKK